MIQGTLRTVKYVFALTNLVLVCFALGLIALATNWRTELFPIKEIEKLGITEGAAIALIIIGSVLFILSFLGSAGSLAENECMLMSFAVIVFILLLIELALAALLVSFGGSGQDIQLNEFVRKHLEQASKEYNKEDSTDRANWYMDFFQRELKCCGVYDSKDWTSPNTTTFIPASCCFNETGPALKLNDLCKGVAKYVPETGCVKQAMDMFREHIFLIGSCALIFALIEMIAISVAYCLSCAIRSRD